MMTNKVTREKSRFASCMSDKSTFHIPVFIEHVDILLKVHKSTENVNSKVLKTKNKKCYYQIVLHAKVKSQDLWKNKKQKDY